MASSSSQRSDDSFWNERKAAAMLKHGILDRYLPVFTTKTGTSSPNSRVVYFDGYAGQGRYDDGTEGSPLIAARVSQRVAGLRNPRQLCLFLVEKDPDRAAALKELMTAEVPGVPVIVRDRDVADHIGELIRASDGLPLFAFVDPYGRGLPVSAITGIMNRPVGAPGRPPTEVLINFSDPMVRRAGGLSASPVPHPSNAETLARMDENLGGPWWREAYSAARVPSQGVQAVVNGYRKRLEQSSRCQTWCVAVRNRPDHEPRYYLILLTRHPDGLWKFGEAVSNALEEWRKFLEEASSGGMESMFDVEAYLGDQWTNTIADNIARLISQGAAPFTLRDRYAAVMGDAFGQARGKHIRAAIRRLYQEGRTATDGRGEIDKLVIRPPTGR